MCYNYKYQTSLTKRKEVCHMEKGILERVILSSLGFVSVTEEKVQKMIDDLVKEGEISQKDGAVMVKKIMDRMDKNSKEMEKRTEKIVKDVIAKADIPGKKDISSLEKKIDSLNKKLDGKEAKPKK